MATGDFSPEERSRIDHDLRQSSWACKHCDALNSFAPLSEEPRGRPLCEDCRRPPDAESRVYSDVLAVLPDPFRGTITHDPNRNQTYGYVCCDCGTYWEVGIKPKRTLADVLLRRTKSQKRKQRPEATFDFHKYMCRFCWHGCCENCLRFRLREKDTSASRITVLPPTKATVASIRRVGPKLPAGSKSRMFPSSAPAVDSYLSRFPLDRVCGLRTESKEGLPQSVSPFTPPSIPVRSGSLLKNPITYSPDTSDSSSVFSLDSTVEYGAAVEARVYEAPKPIALTRRRDREEGIESAEEANALIEESDAIMRGLTKLGLL